MTIAVPTNEKAAPTKKNMVDLVSDAIDLGRSRRPPDASKLDLLLVLFILDFSNGSLLFFVREDDEVTLEWI